MRETGPRGRRRALRRERGARRASAMTETFTRATGAVRARLDRATPRERVLLLALAAGGLVALPFLAQGWAAGRIVDAAADTARLQALRAADDGARLRGATLRLAELEGRVRDWSPPAPSFPTARVLVEQEVAVAAAQAGVTGLEVHAADTPDRIGPASFVRVEVTSSFSWASLAQLTRRLAAERPGTVVDRVSTDGAGADARLHLVLLAPFREGVGREGVGREGVGREGVGREGAA